jgi:RimJ/RimL family protein N-acetyltransferase
MAHVLNMTSFLPKETKMAIRPVQYRDLDALERLAAEDFDAGDQIYSTDNLGRKVNQIRPWFGPLKFLSWFPNPCQHTFCVYVAEQDNQVRGTIQVSPFNRTRSTWRVEQVVLETGVPAEVGSQLLRYCFESILEARTWLLEVNVNNKATLALYRQNGFQPLAQLTYWAIAPELLSSLQEREPDLPNLLPVSNADAQLLYQLDTVSMPPLLRQVYDRHIHDFKTSFAGGFLTSLKQWIGKTVSVSGYVFEPQRKAAIGYFQIFLSRDGSQPHVAQLTVHPAYTWLYPELLSQMARIAKDYPSQSLQLASADYQPEREEYLEQLGAERISHSLLMSRSVWHKLREAKPISLEGLQLAEMLQGLQPARKPVPGRMSWLKSKHKKPQVEPQKDLSSSVALPQNGGMLLNSQALDATKDSRTERGEENGENLGTGFGCR